MRDDFELPQFPDFLTEFDLNNELFQVNEVVSPDGALTAPSSPYAT